MTRLFDIARGVAPLLDGRFRYNRLEEEKANYDWGNRAVLSDDTKTGRQIIFKNCWRKSGRIEITGLMPRGYGRTAITVAQTRDIPAIAGDINRRFLPPYLEEWNTRQAEINDRAAKLEAYGHQVDLLRRICPEFRKSQHGELTGYDEFYFQNGQVRLSSDSNSQLRLSLPFDDLVRVLMYLNQPRRDEIT